MPYASNAGHWCRWTRMRQGRNTATSSSVAKARRSAVAPVAPTAGNRCLASDAPDWMETMATSSRAIGCQRDAAGEDETKFMGKTACTGHVERPVLVGDTIAHYIAQSKLNLCAIYCATLLHERT